MERMEPSLGTRTGFSWIHELPWPAHLVGPGLMEPNAAMARALGYEPETFDEGRLSRVAPTDLERRLATALASSHRETILQYLDATGQPVTFRRARVVGRAGEVMAVLLAGADLNGRDRNQLMARITGVISHDLNNVFTISQSYLELLRRHRPSEVQREEYLKRIGRAVRRGIDLNETMQTLSAGRRVPMAPCHLEEVVESLRGLLPRILAPGPVWSFAIEEDLPPLFSHPVTLTRLVIDLCVNGRRRWPEAAELLLRVRRARSEGPACLVRVQPVGVTGAAARRFEPYLLSDEVVKGDEPPLVIEEILFGGDVTLDVTDESIIALLPAPKNLAAG